MIATGWRRLDLVPRGVVGEEDRVDVELANAAGDELGVLAAEVQDDDRLGGDVLRPRAAARVPDRVHRSLAQHQRVGSPR